MQPLNCLEEFKRLEAKVILLSLFAEQQSKVVKDFPTLPVNAFRTQSKEAVRGKDKARRKQGPDPLERVCFPCLSNT